MRRREFLLASASVAGGLVGGGAVAGIAPCPPEVLRVSGGSAVRSACAVRPPPGGPGWFRKLRPLQWTPLAGGGAMSESWQRGDCLAEAVPPPPYFGNYGPRYLTAGWNGACVDHDNLQMILALNGGHAARQENDAYALDLGAEVPGWRRILEATPPTDPKSGEAFINRLPITDPNGKVYESPVVLPGWLLDGPAPEIAFNDRQPDLRQVRRRPRTLHTCSHYHYSNGKVWFPIMNAWDRGSGATSLVKLALDVAALRSDPSLAAWRYGDIGPWQYVGVIREQTGGGQDAFGFGVGALDRSTGKIWYVGQRTASYWSMDTLGATTGQHRFYDDAPREKDLSSSAGAIAHGITKRDGRETSLFVMMEQGSHRLWILDTAQAGTGTGWSSVEPANARSLVWSHSLRQVAPGYEGHPPAYGMVYHAPARCFLAYNCDQLPDRASVRVLRVPFNSDGSYDPDGHWEWDQATFGDTGPDLNNPRAAGGGGSYTRFNSIPDYAGTGDTLLIHLSSHNRPTWVCRLPASALA